LAATVVPSVRAVGAGRWLLVVNVDGKWGYTQYRLRAKANFMTTPFAPLTYDEHQELDNFLMYEADTPDGMTFC